MKYLLMLLILSSCASNRCVTNNQAYGSDLETARKSCGVNNADGTAWRYEVRSFSR